MARSALLYILLGNLMLAGTAWLCCWALHRWQRAIGRREQDESAPGFPIQFCDAPRSPRFPSLVNSQVALLHADTRTGIVLSLDGQWHTGTGDKYLVFPSRAEADDYARRAVRQNTELECAIFDHAGDCLTLVRPEWTRER